MTDTVAGISVGALFALVASAPLEELPLRALIMAGLAVLGGVLFNVFGRMPGLLDGLRAAAVKSARLAAAAVRASARAGATVLGHLARAFLALAGGAAGLFKGRRGGPEPRRPPSSWPRAAPSSTPTTPGRPAPSPARSRSPRRARPPPPYA
ncbi:hypothetical protein [Thermocatellispora tengchongensis]|uniref:hypothetical protein n=1 Tax=Thermocatellispora tengchongensis TaxID=1073253 RepID=UPI00363B8F06